MCGAWPTISWNALSAQATTFNMLKDAFYFRVTDPAELQTQHNHTDEELVALKVQTRGQGASNMENARPQVKLGPGAIHLWSSLASSQHCQCHQLFTDVSVLCMQLRSASALEAYSDQEVKLSTWSNVHASWGQVLAGCIQW